MANVNLPCVGDVFSYNATPDEVYGGGNATNLCILGYSLSWLGIPYLKFDIAALTNIPPENITKAELRFYYYGHQLLDPPFAIKRVLADWNETTLTWNNQPARSTSYLDCAALTTPYGWKTYDILTMVKEWIAGTYPNYGLALEYLTMSNSQNSYLYSKDYNSGQYAPYIYVEYEPVNIKQRKYVQLI